MQGQQKKRNSFKNYKDYLNETITEQVYFIVVTHQRKYIRAVKGIIYTIIISLLITLIIFGCEVVDTYYGVILMLVVRFALLMSIINGIINTISLYMIIVNE